MAGNGVTAAEIATWLTPGEALGLLSEGLTSTLAVNAIVERLKGGMIDSGAANSSWEFGRRGRIQGPTGTVLIPSRYWSFLNADADTANRLWVFGDVRFYLGLDNGRYSEVVSIRYFGIRFDPAGIQQLVQAPAATTTPRPDPLSDAPNAQEPPALGKGPPVSDALLKEWYELYRRAYGGQPEDTLPNAWKSAQGMFPGKSVSRDRVRALAGGRKVGRKTRTEDE
jgi:hypothetical protein